MPDTIYLVISKGAGTSVLGNLPFGCGCLPFWCLRAGPWDYREALNAFVTNGSGGVQSVLQMMSMFNGGTIMNASLFGLGIMPYISASIIMQILAFSFPALKALQKKVSRSSQN